MAVPWGQQVRRGAVHLDGHAFAQLQTNIWGQQGRADPNSSVAIKIQRPRRIMIDMRSRIIPVAIDISVPQPVRRISAITGGASAVVRSITIATASVLVFMMVRTWRRHLPVMIPGPPPPLTWIDIHGAVGALHAAIPSPGLACKRKGKCCHDTATQQRNKEFPRHVRLLAVQPPPQSSYRIPYPGFQRKACRTKTPGMELSRKENHP